MIDDMSVSCAPEINMLSALVSHTSYSAVPGEAGINVQTFSAYIRSITLD
jgi:hypothetical protein